MLSVLRSKILTQESAEVENLHAKLHLALSDPTDYSPQASLSMGFSRQEYWSGLLFPSRGIFQTQGLKQCLLHLLHWRVVSLPTELPGRPKEKLEGQLIQQLSNVIKKPRFLPSFCLAIPDRFSLCLAKTPYIWLQGIWHSLRLYIKMWQCVSPLWIIYLFLVRTFPWSPISSLSLQLTDP